VSDWYALQEAPYKRIDTIQYNTIGIGMVGVSIDTRAAFKKKLGRIDQWRRQEMR